jgi:hypothetical protein
MLAVECRAGMSGDVDGAHRLAACGIECVEFVAGCEPDLRAVIGDAVHAVDALEGAIFADDFGC